MLMRDKVILLVFFTMVMIIGCSPPDNPMPELVVPTPLENESTPILRIAQEQESDIENHQQENVRRDSFSPLFTPLEGCEEKEQVTFTSLPLDLATITVVEPQGELTGFVSGHITPGDHVGFQYDKEAPATKVYALADGYVVRVERNPGYFGIGTKNYHLYIEYSCTLFGSYVHVTEIAPELLQADSKLSKLDALTEVPNEDRNLLVRIPIRAGQVIGKTEKWGLLGMLTVDMTRNITGFVTPQLYAGEPWKTHAVPAFNYFTEPLKKQLMLKNPRTKEPRGGKIDFDVDGTLAGNWFMEGTDYAGDKTHPFCGDYICPYWNSHLAFVYDFVLPLNNIRVSIGYDAGLGDQGPYGVKGYVSFPEHITVTTGPVKYELVKLKDITAERGFTSQGKALITENTNEVLGTLLVQMTGPRKIKIEVFPGKNAAQVTGFSSEAKVYYR